MPRFRRRLVPDVIASVQVSDGRGGQFRFRRIIQASNVDTVEFPPARRHAGAERAYAAMPAKEMLVGLAEELVQRQRAPPGQQAERFGLDDGGPEARLDADGTIAAQRTLAQIDIGLEADFAAMAAAVVCFHTL